MATGPAADVFFPFRHDAKYLYFFTRLTAYPPRGPDAKIEVFLDAFRHQKTTIGWHQGQWQLFLLFCCDAKMQVTVASQSISFFFSFRRDAKSSQSISVFSFRRDAKIFLFFYPFDCGGPSLPLMWRNASNNWVIFASRRNAQRWSWDATLRFFAWRNASKNACIFASWRRNRKNIRSRQPPACVAGRVEGRLYVLSRRSGKRLIGCFCRCVFWRGRFGKCLLASCRT